MSRRVAIVIGLALVLVTAAGLATLARSGPEPADDRSDRASFVRHRERAQRRPLVPRTPSTPEPPKDEGQRQSGSSEGGGVHIERLTEHHRVSGSGSVAVTSGAVDEGTGGSERDGSFVGPRRPRSRP